MHFTYDGQPSKSELMQGDVLERTPALNQLLLEVHPYYSNHPKNLYFMVLTQSCDLVRRQPGGRKATYISIAPVRTLDYVVERYIQQASTASVKADLPVIGSKSKTKASEFLQRLFNNNEPGYFFLCANDTNLNTDCVAFLQLSIAIKADLHFQTCLDAKILQLDQTFQAKLGWLFGQLYSRVGTTDWPLEDLKAKIKNVLNDAAIWVEESKIGALEATYQKLSEHESNAVMTEQDISKAVSSAPTKKQLVLDQAEKVISAALGPARHNEVTLLRRRLESDSALTSLLSK